MFFVRKLFLFLAILPITTAAFNFKFKKDKIEQTASDHKIKQIQQGYNSPANFKIIDTYSYRIASGFILWQPREKGLEIGNLLSYSTGKQVLNMNFKYNPGFKVLCGINFEYGDWNIFAEYTRLKINVHNSSRQPASNENWAANWMRDRSSGYRIAKGEWDLNYNTLDFLLERPYYIGRGLIFETEVGGRFFNIKQKMKAEYTNNTGVIKSHNKTISWALGPKIGFKTNWLLGQSLRFFCNTGGSLVYQCFKDRTKQYNDKNPAVIKYYVKNSLGYITPNVELTAGFGWGTYFSNNCWHFDFILGYDFLYFWNQNTMRNLVDKDRNSGDGDAGNLMLHGLTTGIKFDF